MRTMLKNSETHVPVYNSLWQSQTATYVNGL